MTFTVTIDEKMDRTLEELKGAFGKTSKADVFRLGVTLLHIAKVERERGNRLVVANAEDKVIKELVLP